MSEKQKSKTKNAVYRKIHKSLGHLKEDTVKHTFEKRLRGSLQRQESEPVYFGVSVMSAPDNSELEMFESVTNHNYQEAAKRRTTRTLLVPPKHQGPRRGTSTRLRPSRSPEQSRQADCPHGSHLREQRADSLPGDYTPAQAEGIQREGLLDGRTTLCLPVDPIPSQLIFAEPFPFPTPCSSMASPHFVFPTEVHTFRPISPSTAFRKNNGISGLESTIDQSFHQEVASHPQPPNDYQESCGEVPFYPHAGPSTLQPYNFPAEAYDFNLEFPTNFFSSIP